MKLGNFKIKVIKNLYWKKKEKFEEIGIYILWNKVVGYLESSWERENDEIEG